MVAKLLMQDRTEKKNQAVSSNSHMANKPIVLDWRSICMDSFYLSQQLWIYKLKFHASHMQYSKNMQLRSALGVFFFFCFCFFGQRGCIFSCSPPLHFPVNILMPITPETNKVHKDLWVCQGWKNSCSIPRCSRMNYASPASPF